MLTLTNPTPTGSKPLPSYMSEARAGPAVPDSVPHSTLLGRSPLERSKKPNGMVQDNDQIG